jgi:hypothetical protein
VRYHSVKARSLTIARYPGIGRYQGGSLTGAVASQSVTEAHNGALRLDGNQPLSVKAEERLTVRGTARTGTKVGLSDPTMPRGRVVAKRIKVTLGITG